MLNEGFARLLAIAAIPVMIAGCQTMAGADKDILAAPAKLEAPTKTTGVLQKLPPPARQLEVAVYEFPDQTGQHKPSGDKHYAEFSRAVTQGGADILIDVLREAGGGTWFDVVERRRLPSLLQEREIIEVMHKAAGKPLKIQSLRVAGLLLEGGIVGYDTNETTGGLGARLLGIGGHTQFRRDVVTVALRAVSVQTGRVLASVTTTKTIYSALLQGTTFKFVAVDDLLEIDTGVTRNHPTTLAVREAIQLAVYALLLEGIESGLWEFADPAKKSELLSSYVEDYRPQLSGLY